MGAIITFNIGGNSLSTTLCVMGRVGRTAVCVLRDSAKPNLRDN